MKFKTIKDFTSLTDLLRIYGDADEIIFKSYCELDESEIAEACRRGRRLANHLRLHNGSKTAEQIAGDYGCKIVRESWQIAEGKVVFFAECNFHPSRSGAVIRLNTETIESLVDLMASWATEPMHQWFSEPKISEVAIAHELYHLIEQHSPSTAFELAAHAFARTFAELPFSPLLYNVLLVGKKAGKGTLKL